MMQVTVYVNNGPMWVRVEWNDHEDPCQISGEQFGTYHVNNATLRALYEALAFLYERGETNG